MLTTPIAQSIEELVRARMSGGQRRPDVLVGLVGRGIQQSRTPAMHEHEARRQGLSCAYMLIDFDVLRLADEDLEPVLATVRQLGFNGVNVTYPFKQAIIPLLDDVAPEADTIGAVNTVVFGPRTVGHNTDHWGFAESFRAQMQGAPMERVTVFGAGGAGSAVGAALADLGAREISIIDQDEARARELASRLGRNVLTQSVAARDALAAVRAAGGIVNTTPVGMARHPGTPFPTEWLRREQWVADIIYFPRETELLRRARALGCRTLPGIGMAIGQAVRSFEHFTGHSADMTAMAAHFEAAA